MRVHEMPPAEQVERYWAVIAHVTEAIARHAAVAARAEAVQRSAALQAAEGDQEARRILAEAANAEAQARAEARSLAMALDEARKRLAEAEAAVEAGRLSDLERRAVEAARVRVEAARGVDAAVAVLAEAYAAFEAAGQCVAALMGEPGGSRVLAGIDLGMARNVLLDAMPHGLREPLRLPYATGEVRPKLAEADPVARWLAGRDGGGTDPRMAKVAVDVEAQEAARLELAAGGRGRASGPGPG